MKKLINISSILVLVLTAILPAAFLAANALNSSQSLILSVLDVPQESLAAFAGLPVDQTRQVQFDVDENAWAQLSRRDRDDQALDWLLFTVVSDSGISIEEVNQTSFDIPTVRYGYLQPSAKFEFGKTRSLQIGQNRVVALIPAKAAEESRDLLADIADRQRTNTGKIPDVLILFEYELSPDQHSAALTRRADLQGADLFSPAYGYYEFTASDLPSLTEALAKLDDITFADMRANQLIVGGRDLSNRSTLDVDAEDVAAIWQAANQIDQKNREFCARWKTQFNQEFQTDSDLRPYLSLIDPCKLLNGEDPGLVPITADSEQHITSFMERMLLDREQLGIIGGLGFSLDPYYDFKGLQGFFSEKRPAYQEVVDLLITSYPELKERFDLESIESALFQEDPVPFLKFSQDLESVAGVWAEAGTEEQASTFFLLWGETDIALHEKYQYQAARYDGNLQGTKVGMTLFYTDLLAKLWSFDYQRSAPRTIEDFVPQTEIRLSEVFRKEITDFPNTRLWFGPQSQGFQLGSSGNEILFDRIATRVYAASSNPLEPGQEVAAHASSAKYLGWWNDHYAEVAQYEPEYERLNAIMKWSLLIGWLGNSDREGLLGFLESVSVDRNNRFPQWVHRQPALRFQQWDTIAFHEPGFLDSKTETLPILLSESFNTFPNDAEYARALNVDGWYSLSGGVSLADDVLFQTVKPIPNIADDLLLRPGLGSYADDALRTVDDISYQFTKLSDEVFVVNAQLPEGVKLRSRDADVLNKPIQRVVSGQSSGQGLRFNTQIDDVAVGTLDVAPTQNGFQVGWLSRDIDKVQQFARRMSEDGLSLRTLDDPTIQTVIELPGQLAGETNFLVQFKGTGRWMRVSDISDATTGSSARVWQSRVASLNSGDRIVGIQWEGDILGGLKSGGQGYLVGGMDESKYFNWITQAPPATAKAIKIRVGEMEIDVWLDIQSRQVYFPFNKLPDSLQAHPEALKNLVRPTDLPAEIIDGIALQVPMSRLGEFSPIGRGIVEGDYGRLARQIVDDPALFYAEKSTFLDDSLVAIDDWLKSGQSSEALAKIDQLTVKFGAHPKLIVRKSLALMDKGLTPQLAEELTKLSSRSVDDLGSFFDEVNLRLGSQPAGLESPNLYTMSQYVDWKSLQANQRIPGGSIQLDFNGQKLGLQHVLDVKPSGQGLKTVNINSNVPVYVQDSPALSNLDWQVSINDSLNQVVSGNLGKVVVLPRGDIAFYKPALIFDPDRLAYRLVGSGTPISPTQFLRFNVQNFTQPQCDLNDVSNQQDCVVLVTAEP